jgi:hypothetical protein
MLTAILAFSVSACGEERRKLDEVIFLDTPQLTLKLVRYYEAFPLSYNGEIYVTQCSSLNSKGLPPSDVSEAGWRVIDRGSAIGSKSASQMAEQVKHRYTIIDGGIVYWSHVPLSISLDGCHSEISWSPVTLPTEMIIPAAQPEHCKQDKATCQRMYGPMWPFQAEGRLPKYFDVRATRSGEISFRMESTAIKDGNILFVATHDGGTSWDVKIDHLYKELP